MLGFITAAEKINVKVAAFEKLFLHVTQAKLKFFKNTLWSRRDFWKKIYSEDLLEKTI